MEPEKEIDVLILGAGLAGLSAAHQLQKKAPNLSFIVAEAKDRIGGRTLSLEVQGPNGQDDRLDLGAHWICERQKDIMDIVHEFGIEYYPQNIKGKKVMQIGPKDLVKTYQSEIPPIGSLRGLIDSQRFINYIESLVQQVDISDPYASPLAHILDSKTLEDLVKDITHVPAVFEMFNAACLACFGCDMNQISALFVLAYANSAGGMMKLLFFSVEDHSAQEYRIKGGSQQISQCLLNKVGKEKLRLKHRAVRVEQKEKVVEVFFDNGQVIRAKKVIMSLPPNIIVKNLSFLPELPYEKVRLYKAMPMANLTKVFVVFKTSFWLEDGFSGEVVSNGGPTTVKGCEKGPAVIFFDATTKLQTPVMVGFIGGKASDQWNSKPLAQLQEAVLHQLESYFGESKVKQNFLRFIIKDWAADDDIEGGPVNYVPPGQMHNFDQLRRPHINVHFAGTITSTSWAGYMDGAVQSGRRAVAEVLLDLQRQATNKDDLELVKKAHPERRQMRPSWTAKHGQGAGFFTLATSGRVLLGLFLGMALMHQWRRIQPGGFLQRSVAFFTFFKRLA